MKNRYLPGWFLLTILLLSLPACKEDCDACFTPPPFYTFMFIDKTSGENLFGNGTYDLADFDITNTLNSSIPEYELINPDTQSMIRVTSIGWESEIVQYDFNIDSELIFSLSVDTERKLEDCCSFTKVNDFSISNVEFEYNNTTDIYTILID